jgi:hypothetical protein
VATPSLLKIMSDSQGNSPQAHRGFEFHKRRQLSSARTTKRFPSPRCASNVVSPRPDSLF